MDKHTIADGNIEERRYPDTDSWSRPFWVASDPWDDQAMAEREAILIRWAGVLEAFRQLRQL